MRLDHASDEAVDVYVFDQNADGFEDFDSMDIHESSSRLVLGGYDGLMTPMVVIGEVDGRGGGESETFLVLEIIFVCYKCG